MKEIVDDRDTTGQNPIAVIMDIKRQNSENETLHTQKLKRVADKVRKMAAEVHQNSGRVFEPNYRKTEITVKAEGARPRDKLHPKWDEFEQYCDANGVTKKTTVTGWVYVIK